MKAPIPPFESPRTYILAGRDADGVWREIETATVEADETPADVLVFLQTMAQARTRDYMEMEIMSAAEFARRFGPEVRPEAA
jgi:hypothetical protein